MSRSADTYRAARKAFVKTQADEAGKKFRDLWPASVHCKTRLDIRTVGMRPGKYMPHQGKRECERRLRVPS